ncbi:MAG: hypothetical protein IKV49_04120 [Clostridia bacterium]|nr:hypothetical protein [Clostridia bacterium]
MKESIIKAITAVICAAVVCITSTVAIGNYSDAVKEAAKLGGTVTGTSASDDAATDESTDEIIDNQTEDVTDAVADETIDNGTEENTDAAATPDTTQVSNEAATQSASKQMTTAEIVALFNTSANKIKTDAKKVVKNYEKRTVNEEQLKMPSGLEDTGREMMKKYMSDDTEPIVYETREDIRNEYIVPDQDYVSKLQPSSVVKATCVDNGKTYEIYIKLKDQKNPTAGNGVGAVCDVIEGHEIAEKVSLMKKFDTYYSNCEIKATIDKATGKMTHTNYKTPVLLDLTINMFGTHDVSVGYTFEKDYTITY